MTASPSDFTAPDQEKSDGASLSPVSATVRPLHPRRCIFENGFEVTPVDGKACVADGWRTGPITAERARAETQAYPHAKSTGARTGYFAPFDVDLTKPEDAERAKAIIFEVCGPTPGVRVGSKGFALCYRNATPIAKAKVVEGKRNDGAKPQAVEVLGIGQQLVVHGIHKDTGQPYRWIGDFDPARDRLDALPLVTPEKIFEALDRIAAEMGRLGYQGVHRTGAGYYRATMIPDAGFDRPGASKSALAGEPLTIPELTRYLSELDPPASYEEWRDDIASIRACPGPEVEELRDVARAWSRGELMFDDRYKDGPPSAYLKPGTVGGLCEDEAVDAVFDTMPPKPGGRAIGSIIRASNKAWNARHPAAERFKDFTDAQAAEPGERPRWSDPDAEFVAPEFPLDVLPDTLQTFVEFLSRQLGIDQGTVAMAALTVCSSAITQAVRLRVTGNTGFVVRSRLWTNIVLASGGGKSTVFDPCLEPLQAAQAPIMAAWKKDHARWKREQKIPGLDAGNPPVALRYLGQDGTTQGLVKILAEQERGLLLVHHELEGLLGQMDRFNKGGGGASADMAFYNQAYDGKPYYCDTVSRGTIHAEHTSISILTAVQPDLLRRHGDLTANGFLPRFLPVMMQQRRSYEDVADDGAAEAYRGLVGDLLTISAPADPLSLTPAALAVTKALHDRLLDLSQLDLFVTGHKAFISKLQGVHGSLMLTLHLLADPMGRVNAQVEVGTAVAAARLVEDFLLPHGQAFYEMLAGNQGEEELRTIRNYVIASDKDRFVTSDFTSDVRRLHGKALSPWDVFKKIDPLVAEGVLLPEADMIPTRAWTVATGYRGWCHSKREALRAHKAEVRARIDEAAAQRSAARASKGGDW